MSAAEFLKIQYPGIKVDIGGIGVDIHKSVPEIELLKPDYALYPQIDYSMGFTSRGCNRNCYFCFVPQKEGKFKVTQHPSEFHNHKFRNIVLMDNNILLDKKWFYEVTDWIYKEKLKIDFRTGLDIRLFDQNIVERLSKLRWMRPINVAFDDIRHQQAVIDGLHMMKDAGINVRKVNVYVYCHDDSQYEDAVARCRIIKSMGAGAYAMLNADVPHTRRMRQLKRWTSRKQAFFAFDIADYKRGRFDV